MIRLKVELQDLNGDWPDKEVTLPCDLRSELSDQAEYVIVSCDPSIPLSKCDDIVLLNNILSDINNVNPGMTEEYLDVLLIASGFDIYDESFVTRVLSNKFMLKDLSDMVRFCTCPQEAAVQYLAEVLGIMPCGMDAESFRMMCDAEEESAGWMEVWFLYTAMGFSLVERPDFCDGLLYLVYWKK